VIAAAAAIDAGVCKTAIKRLVRCSAEDARLVQVRALEVILADVRLHP